MLVEKSTGPFIKLLFFLQDSLKHYREHASGEASDEISDSKRLSTKCPFDDCVSSHFLSTKMFDNGNVLVNDVKDQNPFLSKLGNLLILSLSY